MNRTARRTITVLLAALTLAACQTGRGAMDLAELVPGEIGSWTPAADYPDATYDRQTIFDYMNGAGEVFLGFAYQEMLVRRFEKPEDELTVELYDMGTSADAFGIFSRTRSGPHVGIGQGSQYWAGQVNFWKNRYYVSVFTLKSGQESDGDVLELAQMIADNIEGEGAPPAILRFLPEEGLQEATIRYFHRHTDLNRYYFVADDNILDLDGSVDAVMANYRSEEEYNYLLLVGYPDEERAAGAHQSFLEIYMPEALDSGVVQIEDGLWTATARGGRFLAVVFDAGTADRAQELLAAAASRLQGAE